MDAHGAADPRADLAQVLHAWAEAIVANDPARIAAFAHPGWVLVGSHGNATSRERFLAVVASGALTHSRMTFDLIEARVDGETGTTFARSSNAGVWQGRPFTADEWVTDTFVRRDGRWLGLMTTVVPATTERHEP